MKRHETAEGIPNRWSAVESIAFSTVIFNHETLDDLWSGAEKERGCKLTIEGQSWVMGLFLFMFCAPNIPTLWQHCKQSWQQCNIHRKWRSSNLPSFCEVGERERERERRRENVKGAVSASDRGERLNRKRARLARWRNNNAFTAEIKISGEKWKGMIFDWIPFV